MLNDSAQFLYNRQNRSLWRPEQPSSSSFQIGVSLCQTTKQESHSGMEQSSSIDNAKLAEDASVDRAMVNNFINSAVIAREDLKNLSDVQNRHQLPLTCPSSVTECPNMSVPNPLHQGSSPLVEDTARKVKILGTSSQDAP